MKRSPLRYAWAALAALTTLILPLAALADESNAFTAALQKGPHYAAGAALLGGLLTAATPCVYPMIAITVSVFGASEAKSRREAMLLSTAFVFGIVCLFTPMIVGAALTGKLFGAALQSKWVVIGIVAIFAAMAASMFGAFELTLPESLMQRLNAVGGVGYGGAFLLGLVSGLVAAPCTGPVLTGILVFIGQTRDAGLGAIFGAFFSIGLGIPFWLVGTFAVSLPKSGKWMVGIKSFFGIVMLVVALYFLKNAFPFFKSLARPDATFMAVTAGLLVAGIAIGAVHLAWDDDGVMVKARKGIGIVLSVVGGFLFVTAIELPREAEAKGALPVASGATSASAGPNGAAGANGHGALAWERSEEQVLAKAKAEKRPVLVDLTADWCIACKETAKYTFADPRVVSRMNEARFINVQVDGTNDEDPEFLRVKNKYKVVGLPTVILLDSEGVERKRFTEFVKPEAFLAALDAIH